jgi:hypothetical protein
MLLHGTIELNDKAFELDENTATLRLVRPILLPRPRQPPVLLRGTRQQVPHGRASSSAGALPITQRHVVGGRER